MADTKLRNKEISRVKSALSAGVSKIPFTMFNTITDKNAIVLVGGIHKVEKATAFTVCSTMHLGDVKTTSSTTQSENYNFIGDPLIMGLRSLIAIIEGTQIKNVLVVIATDNLNVGTLNFTDYRRCFSGSSTEYTHLGEIHSMLTIPLQDVHVGVQVINVAKLRRQAWDCEPFLSFKSKMESLVHNTVNEFTNEIKRSAEYAYGRKKSV